MKRIAIGLMTVAVIAACKVNKEAPKNTGITSAVNTEKNEDTLICEKLILDAERSSLGQTDPYTIMDARIKGQNLEIDVQYGGGCGDAEFDLVWNGALMKSMPPKANVALLLKDSDPCKALLTKTVCFDISSIYKGECVILLKDYRGVLTYK